MKKYISIDIGGTAIRLAVDELEIIQAREFISLKQLAISGGKPKKYLYLHADL